MNDPEEIENIEPDEVLDEPERQLSGARDARFDSRSDVTVRPPASGPVTPEPMVLNLDAADVEDEATALADVASGMGLSWDYVRKQRAMPLGLKLRALTECLAALGALHTDLVRVPSKRSHGAVWYGNLLFRLDGTALLVKDENVTPQPSAYTAPELRLGRRVDQQADVFAVGVMLLEAIADQSLRAHEVAQLSQGDLAADSFWSRFAEDPLLWVAMRATAREPNRRWATAREFADALTQCAFERMQSKRQLGDFIAGLLAEQADRATPLLNPVFLPTSSRTVSANPVPPLPPLPEEQAGSAAFAPPPPLTEADPLRPTMASAIDVLIEGSEEDTRFYVPKQHEAAAGELPATLPGLRRRRRWGLPLLAFSTLVASAAAYPVVAPRVQQWLAPAVDTQRASVPALPSNNTVSPAVQAGAVSDAKLQPSVAPPLPSAVAPALTAELAAAPDAVPDAVVPAEAAASVSQVNAARVPAPKHHARRGAASKPQKRGPQAIPAPQLVPAPPAAAPPKPRPTRYEPEGI